MHETLEEPQVNVSSDIQSTTDYNQFKFLKVNRPVETAPVIALMKAISKKNLLHLNPIIVNDNMEIIDGQHRLMAAKKLGVPIFYIQDSHVSLNDIAGMNSNKKNWTLKDYLYFYAHQGVEDYIIFDEFCKKNPAIPAATLLGLASADGKARRTYKDGVIDVSNIEVGKQIVEYLRDYADHTNLVYTSRFIEAVSFLVRTGLYDHEHMKSKLESNVGMLQPAASTKGWIENLERIYNRHVRDANIVIFLKRR